jgi:hypothetical protein
MKTLKIIRNTLLVFLMLLALFFLLISVVAGPDTAFRMV